MASETPLLRVLMLGSLQLRGPLGEMTLKGDAEQKVLVRLALTPDTLVSRTALRDQLWPGGVDGAASANVRRGLSDLRAALRTIGAADALQEEGRQGAHLGLQRTSTDVASFRAMAAQGTEEGRTEAMTLVRGRPFDGIGRSGGAWIEDMRRILVAEIDEVLDWMSVLIGGIQHDDFAMLLRIGRLRLDLDPSSQRGLYDVIMAHYELGNPTAALQAVQAFPGGPAGLDSHTAGVVQRIERNLSRGRADPTDQPSASVQGTSTSAVYAAGEYSPNPVFHSDLLGDLEASSTYVFMGADAAPLLGRLMVRQQPLERLHVVMIDPRQRVSVDERVDELLEADYHRYSSGTSERWRLELDLLATIVGLFTFREGTPIDLDLTYHGTQDIHLLGTAAYVVSRRSTASRGMLHPEARRYDSPSLEYDAVRQKINAVLEKPDRFGCRFHFGRDHTEADLLAMFRSSDNTTIHAGNLGRLLRYAGDIASRYSEQLRAMRSTAHHHR